MQEVQGCTLGNTNVFFCSCCFSVFFWIQNHMCILGKIVKGNILFMRCSVRNKMPMVQVIDLVSHLNFESAFKDTQLVAISP